LLAKKMSESDIYTVWSFTTLEMILYSGPVAFIGFLVSTIIFAAILIRSQVVAPLPGRFLAIPDFLLLFMLLATMIILFFSIGIDALGGLSTQGIDSDIVRDFPIRQGSIFSAYFIILIVALLTAFDRCTPARV